MPWRKLHRISNMVRGDEHGVDKKSFATSDLGEGGGGQGGFRVGYSAGALRLDLKVRNYNPYWKYQVNAQFSGVQCASWEG
ncbi:unnamed protein product [Sphagnum jensenii]|uniref:Uncharacterized protein n=1 Tax=Sphagnum jensenii TaxID=128206 RepID=A0ABP0XC28_9BRYO